MGKLDVIVGGYLSNGFKVIPLEPRSKRPSSFLKKEGGWMSFRDREITHEDWERWLKISPDCNVGLLTGISSGVVVIDADDSDAVDFIHRYFPSPVYSDTSRGRHFYYKYNGEFGPLDKVSFLEHKIDILGDTAQVVVGPSIHESGYTYPVLRMDNTLPPFSRKMYEYFYSEKLTSNEGDLPVSNSLWKTYLKDPTKIEEGKRNSTATSIIGGLINMGVDKDTVESLMYLWYNDIPDTEGFDFEEIRIAINSIYKIDKRKDILSLPNVAIDNLVMRVDDFISKYSGIAIRWDIENVLPTSTTGMIIGAPAKFKSWTAALIAVCLSTGIPFLGKHTVPKVKKVLIVQQEDARQITSRRLQLIYDSMWQEHVDVEITKDSIVINNILPMMDIDIWTAPFTLVLSDEQMVNTLEDLIVKNGYDLVIIDPLYMVVTMENHMAKGAQELGRLKRLRDLYGTAFIFVHHTRKTTSPDGISRLDILGSQLLNAWIETGIQIREISGETNKVQVQIHFKGAAPQTVAVWEFIINDEDSIFEVRIDTPEGTTLPTMDNEETSIIEMVQKNQPVTVSALSRLVKVHRSTVSRTLQKLADKGILYKDDKGRYSASGIPDYDVGEDT